MQLSRLFIVLGSNRGVVANALPRFIALGIVIAVPAVPFPAWAQPATLTVPAGPIPDTSAENASTADTAQIADLPGNDSARTALPAAPDSAPRATIPKKSMATNDSSLNSLEDSLDVHSSTVAGLGGGLSIGNSPVFKLWQNGLPRSLAAFGLAPGFLVHPGDSAPLLFTIKENPDIYNLTFPLTLSFNRLTPGHRYGASAAFSWISKNYTSSLSAGADSLGRRIDIGQRMSLFAITIDLLYGRAIPKRYFSVDGAGRTDIVVGLSVTPLLAYKKTTDITNPPDARLSAAGDSVAARINAFSSSGIALGGRTGIATVRALSKNGGLEAGLYYSISWCTRFSADGVPLTENKVSAHEISSKEVSYFSNRFEITFTLIRRLGKHDPEPKTRTIVPAATSEP